MKNSRNDMNETLLNLYMEALVATVLTPERLVMEHTLLIAVLHANVGSEVGKSHCVLIQTYEFSVNLCNLLHDNFLCLFK